MQPYLRTELSNVLRADKSSGSTATGPAEALIAMLRSPGYAAAVEAGFPGSSVRYVEVAQATLTVLAAGDEDVAVRTVAVSAGQGG